MAERVSFLGNRSALSVAVTVPVDEDDPAAGAENTLDFGDCVDPGELVIRHRTENAIEFAIVERESVSPTSASGFVQNVGAAMTLVEGCRDLSETERRTLETAVDRGYFESPREASLGDLADEFGVSKTAVSKNLRRAEGKTMGRVSEALSEMDEEDEGA